MKYIIVIRGVGEDYYESIRNDITSQCKSLGYPIPVFAYLPDRTQMAIEIVWTSEEMELKHLQMITDRINNPLLPNPDALSDFDGISYLMGDK